MVVDPLQAVEIKAKNDTEESGWLGLQFGAHRLLVNLADVHEVLPVPAVQPVPLTKDWFLGMTNVRGNLVSVSDLSLWMGFAASTITTASRIVLLNSVRTTQSAILLDGVLGLQNIEAMQPSADGFDQLGRFHALFDQQSLLDTNGQHWLKLNVEALLSEASFLQPGLGA